LTYGREAGKVRLVRSRRRGARRWQQRRCPRRELSATAVPLRTRRAPATVPVHRTGRT